jgi:hypothetical protein
MKPSWVEVLDGCRVLFLLSVDRSHGSVERTGCAYPKAIHYEFLARAFLDLKQYKDAAEACQLAEGLRQVEEQGDRPS